MIKAWIESLKLEHVNEKTVVLTIYSSTQNLHCEADTAVFLEGLGWPLVGGKKKRGKKKKNFSIQLQKQPLDLHVEVLMGVRCAPNQRNMAGNVSEPKQEEMGLQEL